jgi:hypothetical protein
VSCYNWEHGTIILPAAAVPELKKRLVGNGTAWRTTIETAVRDCRNATTTRSAARWNEHKNTWLTALYRRNNDARRYGHHRSAASQQTALTDEQLEMISTILEMIDRPRNPTVADFTRILGPALTQRTTTFMSLDVTLQITGRNVTWDVPENNRAVERARNSWLATTLFPYLNTITWTRGTGGTIVGNNEHNRESCDIGSGANYIAISYPPAQQRR